MGNEANCCSIKIGTASLNKYELQAFPSQNTELKENEQNVDHQIQSDHPVIKNLPDSRKNICLGLDKLYDLGFAITQFNSGYLDNTEENVVTENMEEDSYFCGGVTQSKLTDYICFKKYSPKMHYTFLDMLNNSRDHKIYLIMNKKSNFKRVLKVQKIPEWQGVTIKKSSNLISVIDNLDHPNILRIFQVYDYKSIKYFVMENMQGGSLRDSHGCRLARKVSRVNNRDMYFQQIKIIMKQILYALCYLHDKNILHMNIQAKNILLSNKLGSKKIIFGKLSGFGYSLKNVTNSMAKIDVSVKDSLMEEQQMLAPQVAQRNEVCLKTDIWLLGLAIFSTITKVKMSRIQNYSSMKNYMIQAWNKIEQNLQTSQSQCLDLIMKMMQYDLNKRLSASQCLEHPWFNGVQMTKSCQQDIRQSSPINFKSAITQRNQNNLISYIQSLIVYRNMTQKQNLMVFQIFHKLDKDKDGTVAIQELIQYFQKQLKENKDEQHESIFDFCLELISNIDKDNSGSIDYNQFNQGLRSLLENKHYTKQAIQEIFDYMDVNGDGQIVIDELKDIMKCCNLQELEYYMKKLDKDYNGSIRRDEFVQYCLQKFQKKTQNKKQKSEQEKKTIKNIATKKSITKQSK